MTRKKLSIDPRIGNDRVGLMLSRQQITTIGHTALQSQMVVDNSTNILGQGSCQISGVVDNPLTPDQRRLALEGLWGAAFKQVFLQDIGATDRSTDWCDYVLDRIRAAQLPEPTDLYSGSVHEARWYEDRFASLQGPPSFTRGMFQVWENPKTRKRIHILDRNTHVPISASQVRSMIERRNDQWRNFVPQKLHDFYEWEYPPHLRAAVTLSNPEEMAELYPVGTKGVMPEDDSVIYILRADGKWRPRTEAELKAKSLGD
jgi:hypothetical protein